MIVPNTDDRSDNTRLKEKPPNFEIWKLIMNLTRAVSVTVKGKKRRERKGKKTEQGAKPR